MKYLCIILLILSIQGKVFLQCDPLHAEYEALIEFYNLAGGENWSVSTGWAEGANGISCNPCEFNGQPWFGLKCQDSNIVQLVLNSNNLIGSISPSLFELEYITIMDLHGNILTGNIPEIIFANDSLERIDFSDNMLTGIVPTTIGDLAALTFVDFHNNDLSGCFSNTHFKLCSLGPTQTKGTGYNFSSNNKLAFFGDFDRICKGAPQKGAPCNDGEVNTRNDVFTEECICKGGLSLFCEDLNKFIDDSCDDGNENTIGDVITEDCKCNGDIFQIYVPNIITRGSQQGNDKLVISTSINPSQFFFELYNRWGGLVFSSNNTETTMNILTSNIDLPDGVYVYRCLINDSVSKIGTVTIIN